MMCQPSHVFPARRINHRRVSVAISGLLAAMSLVACQPEYNGSDAASNGKTKAPVMVQTIVVQAYAGEAADRQHGQRYPAVVMRDRESTLSFRVAGVITRLPWHVGDNVHKQQEIALLENAPYLATQKKLQLELQTMQRLLARNETLVAAGGLPAKELQDRKDAAAALQAAFDAAQYDLQSTVKTSPHAGVVIAKYVEQGETVQAGQPILKIADSNSALIARVSVPTEIAASLRPGQAARVYLHAENAPIQAVVRRIGAYSSTSTGNVEVDVTLPGQRTLASGSLLSVSFDSVRQARQDWVSLPAEAVVSIHNQQVQVWLLQGQQVQAAQANFVQMTDEAMVVSGLTVGSKVVTAGAGLLSQGDCVQEVQP